MVSARPQNCRNSIDGRGNKGAMRTRRLFATTLLTMVSVFVVAVAAGTRIFGQTTATRLFVVHSFVVGSTTTTTPTSSSYRTIKTASDYAVFPQLISSERKILSLSSTTSRPISTLSIPGSSTALSLSSSSSSSEDDDDGRSSLNFGPNSPSKPGLLRRTFPSFPWYRLPNILTYMRCWAIPVLVVSFYGIPDSFKHLVTGSVFAIASFTDWLDGYLARRWDISSDFGAFLDPVADKLMVSTSLILLTGRYGPIVAVPTLIILAREIAVSALREWMAQRGLRDVVKVGIQGKIKTALTMVALTLLLFVPSTTPLGPQFPPSSFSSSLLQGGIALLYLCTLVTVTSGSVYFSSARTSLFPDDAVEENTTSQSVSEGKRVSTMEKL